MLTRIPSGATAEACELVAAADVAVGESVYLDVLATTAVEVAVGWTPLSQVGRTGRIHPACEVPSGEPLGVLTVRDPAGTVHQLTVTARFALARPVVTAAV